MKKQYLLATAVLGALALGGCSSVPNPLNTTDVDQDIYDEYAAECTFKDGKTPAPKWICGYKLPDYPVSEVGYSHSASEMEGLANAKTKLAARIRTDVESVQEVRTKTYGRQERKEFSAVDRHLVDEKLVNTRVLLRQIDPTTQGLYVLVVADQDAYERSMRESQQRQEPIANTDTSVE
jgi:hypothetical protein